MKPCKCWGLRRQASALTASNPPVHLSQLKLDKTQQQRTPTCAYSSLQSVIPSPNAMREKGNKCDLFPRRLGHGTGRERFTSVETRFLLAFRLKQQTFLAVSSKYFKGILVSIYLTCSTVLSSVFSPSMHCLLSSKYCALCLLVLQGQRLRSVLAVATLTNMPQIKLKGMASSVWRPNTPETERSQQR
jgi:hypothetical protein